LTAWQATPSISAGAFLAAEIERQRAARVEGAAGRRIDRIGDLALDRNALAAGHREIGHRAQQHLACRACADCR
jgi:hypothetical protein